MKLWQHWHRVGQWN